MKLNEILMVGISHYQKNDFLNAEKIFLQVLQLKPNEISIFTYLIPALLNQNKLENALFHAEIFYNKSKKSEISCIYLGIIYFKKESFLKSLEYFNSVLDSNPNNYEALLNKGVCLFKLNKNDEAKPYLTNAIKINSLNPIAYVSYAAILEDDSEIDEAIIYLNKAISLNPNDYRSIHALSLLQLSKRDYSLGLKNFEKRWLQNGLVYRHSDITKLRSIENIQNKKILIWNEQGMGDTINFSRYVRELIKLGANVTFEVQEPLFSLFTEQFNCKIILQTSSKNFDYQSPLMSLPYLFNMNNHNIPSSKPYFICNKTKFEFWNKYLDLSNKKLNLGIAISGNNAHLKEYRRKIELKYFLKINEFCKIYIIQKNLTSEQKIFVDQNKEFKFLGEDKNWIDFSDTSAIVENMDLIITIDTSLVHLSGAMNKKTLLLLSKASDWRWPSQNENQPNWYDSVQVFRQKNKNNWGEIIESILPIIKKIFIEKYEG